MGALTHREGPTVQKRRSDRIFISIPLSIRGTDQNGEDFGHRAVTQTVARFGVSIVTKASLFPEQEVTLKPAARKAIRARVIGQSSIGPDGHIYGLVFLNTSSDAWGIHFPPLPEVVNATQLECCNCHTCESVRLNDLELEVFLANGALRRICSQCGDFTTWQFAEDATTRKPPLPSGEPRPEPEQGQRDPGRRAGAPPAPAAAARRPAQPQRRVYPRIQANVKACIAQPGSDDDIVNTVNISRGGILVYSAREYPTESWIQLAVPYTPAAANIFVPARIVRRAEIEGVYQYGIKYVRP